MTLDITVQERDAIPYIGKTVSARFSEFGAPGGPNEAIPRIYQWLAEHQITPQGGPLYVYRHIGDPTDPVDLTVGVPIAEAVHPTSGMTLGALPSGPYIVGRHIGAPDGIPSSQAAVLKWAEENGLRLNAPHDDDEGPWTGRAEHFLTDPAEQPDASKWVTELLFATS